MRSETNEVKPDRRDAAAIAGLWIPYLLLAHYFWWICDDAFISFRYAKNWVAGHGLRYNLGDHPPVEGYSNFLWVVVAGVFEWLGWDPSFWVPAVSLACGMILLALVYRFLLLSVGLARPVSFLATLTLASFPPFAVWGTGGLETMPFALGIFLTFDLLVAREKPRPIAAGIVALAVCLLRTEGIAWALVLALLALAAHARALRTTIPDVKYLAIVVAGFLVYFSLRYAYYGLLFPNPVYTKVKFSPAVALRGFRYVATFFLTFLTPFLVVPATFVALLLRGARVLPVILMAIAWRMSRN